MSKIDDLLKKYCSNEVEYTNIGRVAKIGTGSSNAKDADISGKYPFYTRSQEVKRIQTYEFDEEAIIIPGDGGVGDIFHYIHGKYALHQQAYRIVFNDLRINTKFVYYYFTNNFKNFTLTHAVTAVVKSIRKSMLEKFKIPIPSMDEQNRIVAILDKFDMFVNDISQGLPAEIDMRKKQYEYYRNKLLTFK